MAQARKKNLNAAPLRHHVSRGVREGALIILSAIAVYLLVSLLSYHGTDPGWSHTGPRGTVQNIGGVAGAWFADVFLYLFGFLAVLFPIMVGYSGWLIFRGRTQDGDIDYNTLALRWLGFLLTLGAGCGLASLHLKLGYGVLPLSAGGILGDLIGNDLMHPFSDVGGTLFLLALFLAGMTLFTGMSWLVVIDRTGRWTLRFVNWARDRIDELQDYLASRQMRMQRQEVVREEQKKVENRPPPRIEPVIKKVEPSERIEKERQVRLFDGAITFRTAAAVVARSGASHCGGYSDSALEAMSRLVELKLADFGVEVEVVAVSPGPVITRFELQPGSGVKVSQISNLAKDLARALSAISVRVVDVIPGKSFVGLEIPNEKREIVSLSEIITSQDYEEAGSPLTLALGKDISGPTDRRGSGTHAASAGRGHHRLG